MVKNRLTLQAFEDEVLRREKVDIDRNLQIVESLYEEAALLGVFPLKNPMEGIETKIRIACVVSGVPALLEKLARMLQEAVIPYMVIGGQAVLIYGEPRLTQDIDVTIGDRC